MSLMLVIFTSATLFFTTIALFPLKLPDQRGDFATVVLDSEGFPLRAFADSEGVWRYKVTPDQVSPLYIEALLTYEDRFFYQHPGINPFSLLRAGWQLLSTGEIVSGGSTLTMQVARLLYPHSSREKLLGRWQGKCLQMFRALQLEWTLSKQDILTLYLNYAPFGGTIEGVQAASYQYFQKPALQLRPSEAALLAVLPQAPSRLRPDRYPHRAKAARDKVLERLNYFNTWDTDTLNQARQETIAVWETQSPIRAPLLAQRLFNNHDSPVIQTTINRNIQKPLEDYVEHYARTQGKGISTAILVVENHTHEVKAYIGSSDFLDDSRSGQVDMVQATRSPGSTLKPLLYALALDDHLIHSESLMADVPRLSRAYRPGNFSRGFSGPVSISQALERSLNIPFVQLIEAYGEQRFVNRLSHVLQPLSLPEGHPSAAIILGGAGSSLEKLTSLYSALANKGYVSQLSFIKNTHNLTKESKTKTRRLFSKEAAWITYSTLSQIGPPPGYASGVSQELLPPVAWKSGTSYGHRDAWAIGVTRDYTIGIWLGRPDSTPMDKKMGTSLAGPLLFTAFELVDPQGKAIDKPEGVQTTTICWPDGRSIDAVKTGCDEQRQAWTVKGVTPRTLLPEKLPENSQAFYNPVHTVLVNPDTGLRVDRHCSNSSTRSTPIHLWPMALDNWLPKQYHRSTKIPAYDPSCMIKQMTNDTLRVSGAEDGQVFHSLKEHGLAINLQVEGNTGKVSWYLNGACILQNVNRLLLRQLRKGMNQVVVIDESGSTAQLRLLKI